MVDSVGRITAAPMPILLLMAQCLVASADEGSDFDPSGVVDVVSLNASEVNESSGLAVSRRREGHFWTHNDSGGKPQLYAFDARGRKSGQLELMSTRNGDWEDMASFVDRGTARLLIADCGDNLTRRPNVKLYIVDEPDPAESGECDCIQTVTVVYPDGPRDCEAVAVDSHRRQIVLITKSALPVCGVYIVPLPDRATEPTTTTVTAKRVGRLPLPMITAMDIDPQSGDMWLVTYFHAFRFRCPDRDTAIAKQITGLPLAQPLPRWKQIESVAIDQSSDVWITSEGSPAPLGRLPQDKTTGGDADR